MGTASQPAPRRGFRSLTTRLIVWTLASVGAVYVVKALLDALGRFSSRVPQADDIALLTLRYLSERRAS